MLSNDQSDNKNRPRKLTHDEINFVIDGLNEVKSAVKEVGHSILGEIKKTLYEQLSEIELTPLALSDLKNEVIEKFTSSLIKSGTMVGVHAAEAIGHPITQMALNTFHQSGSAKNVTYGVDRIRELLNASRKQKTRSATIHFKNKSLTKEDVLVNKRPEINDIRLSQLVVGQPEFMQSSEITRPWWYPLQISVFGKIPKSTWAMRLNINVNKLYALKVTMEDIANAIVDNAGGDTQAIFCVFSPISEGIIDLYAIDSEIPRSLKGIDIPKTTSGLMFLSLAAKEELDNIKIRGITGISQLYPVEYAIMNVVMDEEQVVGTNNTWLIKLNTINMLKEGVSIDMVINLFQLAGINVTNKGTDRLIVKFNGEKTPINHIRDSIEEDENKYNNALKNKNADILKLQRSDLLNAAYLVYADTDGTNLKDLLARDDVDSTMTYSNDAHEINATFGIEAARNFLIMEINNVIAYEGIYIDPRHIILLVDFMTSLGDIYGITFSGVSRQSIGPLAKASFEQAMNTFKEAALFGVTESIEGTSANVYIGKEAPFGPNYNPDFIDAETLKQFEHELEQTNTNIDPNEFTDAIEQLNFQTTDLGVGNISMFADTQDEKKKPSYRNTPDLNKLSMFSETTDFDNLDMFGDTTGIDNLNMFGDTPIQPTINITQPSDTIKPPQTKGPIIHSKELAEIAENNVQAPCIPPNEPIKINTYSLLKETHNTQNLAKSITLKPTELGIPKDHESLMNNAQIQPTSPISPDSEDEISESLPDVANIEEFLNN